MKKHITLEIGVRLTLPQKESRRARRAKLRLVESARYMKSIIEDGGGFDVDDHLLTDFADAIASVEHVVRRGRALTPKGGE